MKKRFFKELNNVTSRSITGSFIESISEDVAISSDIIENYKAGNFQYLCDRSMAYHYDSSVSTIIGERQILAFFAKNLDVPLNVDREAVALDKFIASERRCRETNSSFQRWNRKGHYDPYVESVLFTAQRKIASILGSSDFVPGSFPSLESLDLSFGPGANVNVKKNTSARWKLSSGPACSADMVRIVHDVLAEIPSYTDFWSSSSDENRWLIPVEVLPGELMFVAKNAKTDRSIIVEPSINTLVQKGVGKYLRGRLLKYGIDLRDQSEGKTSNRRRAFLSSIDNRLMTVDLSSASDTVATKLVETLLPVDWFDFLSSIRTSKVTYKKVWDFPLNLEKFSSMGNGFTFELETLIFYALTCAICEVEGIAPDVSVYGDDIIAPKEIFFKFEYIFDLCGLEINKEKSFIDGPFRESCGGDYFLGQNVRPFYQKKNWSWASLFSFHNFLVRTGGRFILPTLFKAVEDAIPSCIKSFGPDGYGDGHLLGDWNPKLFRGKDGWGGYVFTTLVQKPRQIKKYLLPGDYLLPFYSAMVSSGGGNHFSVRGASERVQTIRVYTLSRG